MFLILDMGVFTHLSFTWISWWSEGCDLWSDNWGNNQLHLFWHCVYVDKFEEERGKFIPCKHMYFIYRIKMFCDHKINYFINQPTLSINEVKKLLLWET
jgi:hypothetical protein